MTNEDNLLAEIDKVDQKFKDFVEVIDKCENIKELKKVRDIIVYANSIHDLDDFTYYLLILALNVKSRELDEIDLYYLQCHGTNATKRNKSCKK